MIAPSSVSLAQAKPTKREACEIVTAGESCDRTKSMIAPSSVSLAQAKPTKREAREIVTARESCDRLQSMIAPGGTFRADQSCDRAKG
jgi:hypothetical protein